MTKRILALLLTLLLPAAACAQEEWTSLHFDPTDRHGAVDCIFVLAHSHTENTGDKYTMQLEWAAVGGGEGEIRYAGELSMNEPSGLGYFYEQQRESVYWPVKLDMEGMIEPVIALLPETLEEAAASATRSLAVRFACRHGPRWERECSASPGRRGRSRCIWRRPHTARARQTARRRWR